MSKDSNRLHIITLNLIELNFFFHSINSSVVFNIVKTSTSVKFVVIVFCFETFQSIMSLKRRKQ